jgi:hypothetical protein
VTSHDPVTTEIAGLKVKARPLPHAQSKPLLPDITEFMARLIRALVKLIGTAAIDGLLASGTKLDAKHLPTLFAALRKAKVDEAIDRLDPADARVLMDILTRHDIAILQGTTVVMRAPNGQLENYELAKDKDRSDVFDAFPNAYLPILVFAGRVTFERYFFVTAPRASETPSASG